MALHCFTSFLSCSYSQSKIHSHFFFPYLCRFPDRFLFPYLFLFHYRFLFPYRFTIYSACPISILLLSDGVFLLSLSFSFSPLMSFLSTATLILLNSFIGPHGSPSVWSLLAHGPYSVRFIKCPRRLGNIFALPSGLPLTSAASEDRCCNL